MNQNDNSFNILFFNFKGGSGKTTNSSICASYLDNCTLIEVSKLNQLSSRINSNNSYKSVQTDIDNEIEFKNLLISTGNKVIDVEVTKLDIFHKTMLVNDIYKLIDLLIIPVMDGHDDFLITMKYLASLNSIIPSHKIMFSFNRYNEHEYTSMEEQFESFFLNRDIILQEYGIDLNDESNYFVLKEAKAIKKARKEGRTFHSFANEDFEAITIQQRSEPDYTKRLEITIKRNLIHTYQFFEKTYIYPMMEKINKKISNNNQ
jgi:cellulose biosynthesis protein BcsQ